MISQPPRTGTTAPLYFRASLAPNAPWRFVLLVCAAAAFPPQLLRCLLETDRLKETPFSTSLGVWNAVDLLLLTPWIETLLMAALFGLLGRFRCSARLQVAISTVIWAGLHVLTSRLWVRGLYVIWPFYLFSVIFVETRHSSLNRAVVVTASAHMGYNLISAALETAIAALH